MTELQRYGIYVDHSYGEPSLSVEPESDGEWVLYEDVEKRMAELESAVKIYREGVVDRLMAYVAPGDDE